MHLWVHSGGQILLLAVSFSHDLKIGSFTEHEVY